MLAYLNPSVNRIVSQAQGFLKFHRTCHCEGVLCPKQSPRDLLRLLRAGKTSALALILRSLNALKNALFTGDPKKAGFPCLVCLEIISIGILHLLRGLKWKYGLNNH
jgi:hypothetical protein